MNQCTSTYGNERCSLNAGHKPDRHRCHYSAGGGSSWPERATTPTDPVGAKQLAHADADEALVLGSLLPLTMQAKGVDLFSIQANGDIHVRGELVTDDAEIVRGLRSAVAEVNE